MGNSKNIKFGILDSINKKPISNSNNSSNNNDNSSNISDDVNKNISIDNNRNVDRNVSISNTGNNDGNIGGNIVINKPILKEDKLKRESYYLKTSTTKKIKQLAKESGMGISEFLQYFLDVTLNKVEIK